MQRWNINKVVLKKIECYSQLATLGTFSGQTNPYSTTAQPGTSKILTCNGAPSSNPAATFAWSIVPSMTSTSGTVVSLSNRVQVGLDGEEISNH